MGKKLSLLNCNPEVLGGCEAVDAVQKEGVLAVKPCVHYERHFRGNSTSSSYENLYCCNQIMRNFKKYLKQIFNMISHLETSRILSIRCQAGNSIAVHYDLKPLFLSATLHAADLDGTVAHLNCISL